MLRFEFSMCDLNQNNLDTVHVMSNDEFYNDEKSKNSGKAIFEA